MSAVTRSTRVTNSVHFALSSAVLFKTADSSCFLKHTSNLVSSFYVVQHDTICICVCVCVCVLVWLFMTSQDSAWNDAPVKHGLSHFLPQGRVKASSVNQSLRCCIGATLRFLHARCRKQNKSYLKTGTCNKKTICTDKCVYI